MVEIPQAAMAVGDDLMLVDLADGSNRRRKPRVDQITDSLLLEEILDSSLEGLAAAPQEEGEEVLEWLEKDAFPPLDTSSLVSNPLLPAVETSIFAVETEALSKLNIKKKARSKTLRKRRRIFANIFSEGNGRKRCLHCETEETPQWRIGPEGPKTLCNACGVRYRKGRLLPEYRPLNSPTFSPEHHSNSHRRVVGMKKRTMSNSQPVPTGKRGRPPRRSV